MASELDLSGFLKDSSVSDLEWLDVDEVKYRQQDHLPKQNLDIRPDLEALWAREGESPTAYVVPNVQLTPSLRIEDPHTMGDMSQLHGPLRAEADEIIRVARLTLMQSTDIDNLRSELTKRFGLEPLRNHKDKLAGVLQERGLLGRFYVDASDFPTCAKNSDAAKFVNKYASSAKYVRSKTACGDCCHSKPTAAGGSVCGQFQKELKVEVPYSDSNAEAVEEFQGARGHQVQASDGMPAKERIRQAFLTQAAPVNHSYAGVGINQQKAPEKIAPAEVSQQLIQASSLVRKKSATDKVALEAKPVVEFLNREMIKGLSHEDLSAGLKVAFDHDMLKRTHQYWGPLLKESGLYGVIYTKQASFDDCRDGADFFAKHNPSVRAIVAGSKCGSCIYNKTRCMMYGKPLVKNASEVLTQETVDAVLQEHKLAGRLQPWDVKVASNWGATPAAALKAIHRATKQPTVITASSRLDQMHAFYGGSSQKYVTAGLTKREIVKQASKYLNEGLYGQELMDVLRSQFEPRDLVSAKTELKTVLAEQGLQGIHYIDPSVYDDYGKGCNEVSRLYGTKLVKYAKIGSKCDSCVHQINRGTCSKLAKKLVVEPPYIDKREQQRQVLASGKVSEVSYQDLVNNGASMMDEFQMQNRTALDANLDSTLPLDIQFGTGKVKI